MWVSSDSKAGKDAGELAGLDVSTGITASTDLDAVLATEPAVRGLHRDGRQPAARCARGLPAHPGRRRQRRRQQRGLPAVPVAGAPRRAARRRSKMPREKAIRACSSTASTPASPTTCCRWRWPEPARASQQIRCMEIVDYATYDSATVMFDVMGFGKPLDEIPMLLQPGVLSLAWGSVVRQLAAGLGIELDEVTETTRAGPGARGLRHRLRAHPQGQRRGAAIRGAGLVDGQPAVVLEHVTRLREDLCPDWPQPAQPGGCYRIEITGEPSYAIDVCLSSPQRRPQPRRPGRDRDARRQRHPRRGCRTRRNPDHAGPAADHRPRPVLGGIKVSANLTFLFVDRK